MKRFGWIAFVVLGLVPPQAGCSAPSESGSGKEPDGIPGRAGHGVNVDGKVPEGRGSSVTPPPLSLLTAPSAGDIVDEGDMDVEGSFRAIQDDTNGGSGGDFNVFSASGTEGAISLRFSELTTSPYVTWILKVRGSDVLNNQASFPNIASNLPWRVGDDVRWRAWYRPSLGQSGIRIWVNGVAGADAVGTTTGSALAEMTSLSFGGASAALSASEVMEAHTVLELPYATGPEIVCLGDSTLGRINPGVPDVVDGMIDFYTIPERSVVGSATSRAGVGLMAVGGDTVAGQQAKWSVSWWRTQPSVKAVTVEVGINDVLAGHSSSTIITALQALVDEIRSDRADVKILIAEMTPIRLELDLFESPTDAAYQLAQWTAVNEAIRGEGSTPITGVDGRIIEHEEQLDDGSGNLKSMYNYDDLHENSLGRSVVSLAYRAAFVSQGFLR